MAGRATVDTSARKKKKKSGVGDGNDGILVLPDETSTGSLFRRTPKNLINALNEVLLHSGEGAFRQTRFTHWGVNKAAGISIKMKVKGKLGLNINLDQGMYLLTESIFCN